MHFKDFNITAVDAFDVKDRLIAYVKNQMPSQVGQSFSDAIDACLRFKELTEGLDEFAIAKEYRLRILESLERTTKI